MTSKALLYLLITLIIGFGLGMITDRALQIIGRSGMNEPMPERNIIDKMIRNLELEPEQVDSIKPVLKDFFERAENTRELIMQQAEADMDTLRLDLLPYLTKSQIERMEDLGLFGPGPWGNEGPPPPGNPRPGGPPPGNPPSPPPGQDHGIPFPPGNSRPGGPPPGNPPSPPPGQDSGS